MFFSWLNILADHMAWKGTVIPRRPFPPPRGIIPSICALKTREEKERWINRRKRAFNHAKKTWRPQNGGELWPPGKTIHNAHVYPLRPLLLPFLSISQQTEDDVLCLPSLVTCKGGGDCGRQRHNTSAGEGNIDDALWWQYATTIWYFYKWMLPQVYIGYFGKGRHGDTKQDTGPTLGLSARALPTLARSPPRAVEERASAGVHGVLARAGRRGALRRAKKERGKREV